MAGEGPVDVFAMGAKCLKRAFQGFKLGAKGLRPGSSVRCLEQKGSNRELRDPLNRVNVSY